jgi:hypothetical protein
MDPDAWRKSSRPVLATSPGISGPGHASVVPTSDHSGWVVYHTHREPGSGWDRQVRMAPYAWDAELGLVITPDESVAPVLIEPHNADELYEDVDSEAVA